MTQAELLVGLAQDVKLFYDPILEAGFGSLTVGEHTETLRLKSMALRHWLVNKFLLHEGKPPSAQAVLDAVTSLEATARFQNYARHVTHVRVAGNDEVVYLDLADAAWQVVEISARGWRLLPESPVKFRRPRGLGTLPTPVAGGAVTDLRRFVNAADDRTWTLFLAWCLSALRPHGPYCPLAISGEHGSAKSSLAEVAKRLLDPGKAMLRSGPRELRDLMIAAQNGWVLAFDNVSHLPAWLSDALCCMATGAGFSTRQLHTDEDEVIFEAERPVILTSIEDVLVRPDLADRAVLLALPSIPEARRQDEARFWTAFSTATPSLLGSVLTVLAGTLREFPSVTLDVMPRMADFVRWSVAAESALGVPAGAFLAAYSGNREATQETAVELFPIGPTLRALAEVGWSGTATELLERLNREVPESVRRDKGWPSSAHRLSNALKRLTPPLRAVGVAVEFLDVPALGSQRRQIRLSKKVGDEERSERSERSGGPVSGGEAFRGNATPEEAFHEKPRQNAGTPGTQLSPSLFYPSGRMRLPRVCPVTRRTGPSTAYQFQAGAPLTTALGMSGALALGQAAYTQLETLLRRRRPPPGSVVEVRVQHDHVCGFYKHGIPCTCRRPKVTIVAIRPVRTEELLMLTPPPPDLAQARLGVLSGLAAAVRFARSLPDASVERLAVRLTLKDLTTAVSRLYPLAVATAAQDHSLRTLEVRPPGDERVEISGVTLELYAAEMVKWLFAYGEPEPDPSEWTPHGGA